MINLMIPRGVEVTVSAQKASVKSMLFFTLTAYSRSVEIENEKFGFLGSVAGADCAYQLSGRSTNPPDDAPGAARVQFHEVANELPGTHVPKLHGSVVRRGNHEAVARLEASYSGLMFIRP